MPHKGKDIVSSTPSPHTVGQIRSRTKSGSESSTGSRHRTPYVSPSVTFEKKGKSLSKGRSEKSDKGENIDLCNLDSPLCRSLWDNSKCPCNSSTNSWLIDCSKCKQYWHTECVTLDGLNEKDINKLVKWLCPLCYTAPISTTDHIIIDSATSCMSCRNTRTLRDANHEFEVSAAASNLSMIKNISECCNSLGQIDFESFSKSIDTLSQFDNHLKHILLKENSLKGLDSEIKNLSNIMSSAIPVLTSQNEASDSLLPQISETLQSYDSSMSAIGQNINQLQDDLKLLTEPMTSAEASLMSESTNSLLRDISDKLEKLNSDESSIAVGLSDLKQSVQSLQSTGCQTHSLPPRPPPLVEHSASQPASSAHPQPLPIPAVPSLPDQELEHGQVPFSNNRVDFITTDEATELTAFLDTCDFKREGGHSVVSFGEPYEYTGSKSSSNVPPIPDIIKPLLEKVNSLQTELYTSKYKSGPNSAPVINSCLINKYDGPNSFLPRHADHEVTIHPESSIFTVSLGQSCEVKFIERTSGTETVLPCPERSMYQMSRRSQEIFDHLIELGSVSSGVRYSLTFRAVSWRNKNATALLGDSNSGGLRFGSDKRGTFGELMPGQRFWAPRIEDINPVSCMGYTNVVLLCGINDVRQPDIKCEDDVADCYSKLKLKIKLIKKLSPSTKAVFVCRLLPTKDEQLNRKVDTFNRLIHFDLLRTCKDVICVGGFNQFAYNHMLADELSREFDRHGRRDILHLNRSGTRVLAGLIKQSVFFRLNGGVDRRRHTGLVNGRLYANVASMQPVPRQRLWRIDG